jgi:hypothetical protein
LRKRIRVAWGNEKQSKFEQEEFSCLWKHDEEQNESELLRYDDQKGGRKCNAGQREGTAKDILQRAKAMTYSRRRISHRVS